MATDTERLIISLEASVKKFENELKRARNTAVTQTKAIESRFTEMNRKLSQGQARLGGALAGALSIQNFTQFSDTFTKAQNALKVTGLEGSKLTAVFNQIFAVAQAQGAPLEAMATLYGRIAGAQKELGVTGQQVIAMTNTVGQALKVAGTSSTEASGALLQLGQAFGSGVVHAEEFNSVNESMRPLLQAAADGLEEAGGSVAKLSTLVKDGKVSSQAFFAAIEAGSDGLAGKAANANETFAQSFEKIKNAITATIGAINELMNTGGQVSAWSNAIVADIGKIPSQFETTIREVQALIAVFNRLSAAIPEFQDLRSASKQGLAAVDPDRMQRDAPAETPLTLHVKPKRTVSLANYAVPGAKDKKGGGGGGSSAADTNAYQDEIDKIKERTAALQAESETIGQSEGNIAKAKATYDLLNAAKEQGITVGDKERAQIEQLATAYGDAKQKIEDAEKAIEAAKDAIHDFQNIASSGIKGFVDDLIEGKSAADALNNALKNIASRLLDMALDSALKGIFSGGSGAGGLGGILAGIFGGGKATGGSVSANKAYVVGERGPEILAGASGRIIPNSALGKGGGGNVEINVINNANASVSQQQTKTAGGTRIDVMVDEIVGNKLATGGTASNRALRTMGSRQPLTRR